jgi:hypothetical protein
VRISLSQSDPILPLRSNAGFQMKNKHEKAQMFLAILISFFLPILSAYACSSNLGECDAFSNSLSLENPGWGGLSISRLSNVFPYFFAQAPSINPGATILRC